MEITLKFQSSINPGLLQKLKNDEIFLEISNFLENVSGRGSCLSSFPSGNQVDGSPLVAIAKRASRGGCTTVLLTMKK